jgi:UDP-glucose 4-epimerase
VLVTGATGFIGRVLVGRLLESGAIVRGVGRSGTIEPTRPAAGRYEPVVADLTREDLDPRLCDGVGIVYHLAAKTHDLADGPGSEAEYQRINVEGTRRLLDRAARAGVRRVVFVSSVKAVDEGGPDEVDETVAPHPSTAYGRSKLEAEGLVQAAGVRAGFATVCLRLPLVYGPGQRGNLQRMMAAIDRGRFPPLPDTGNRRSMVHVENVAQALILAGRHPAAAGQTYFVTDSRPYSSREIYDAMRSALGRPARRWRVPASAFRALAAMGDLGRRLAGRRVGFDSEAYQKLLGSACYSSARIRRELGYDPHVDLTGSLPALIGALERDVA